MTTPTKACLDAETLAAWVDGGLDTRAAAMAEAHVSSCPRCQEIAGLIVKTTPATAPWPAHRSFSGGGWRSFRAGWLVPLTAGVAAVGLWMIVPSDRTTAPTPAPSATVTVAPVAEPAKQKATDELKFAAPAEQARAVAPEALGSREQGARARDAAKNEAPKLLAKKDTEEKRFDEKIESAPTADANRLRVQAAPPAAAGAPSPAAAAEVGRVEAQAAPARQAFAQVVAREAASPDGSIRWRLTPANTLERSSDHGRTWIAVETGAGGPLASVQAIDANVAVVTTVDGRQFRTTDSGKTWHGLP